MDRVRFLPWIIGMASLASCSGVSTGMSIEQTTTLCEQACKKEQACRPSESSHGLCGQGCAAAFTAFRAEITGSFFMCYLDGKTQMCDHDLHNCWESAQQKATPRPIDMAYQAACKDRLAVCMPELPAMINGEYNPKAFGCGSPDSTAELSEDLLMRRQDCFTKPCGDIVSCQGGVLPPLGSFSLY